MRDRKSRHRTPAQREAIAHWRGQQLGHLVGCVIETLEAYDADDGQNQLVLAGIVAEVKRIEDEYERGVHLVDGKAVEAGGTDG